MTKVYAYFSERKVVKFCCYNHSLLITDYRDGLLGCVKREEIFNTEFINIAISRSHRIALNRRMSLEA